MRMALIISLLAATGLSHPALSLADPCGLVPPVLWAGGNAGDPAPIKRIGAQQTYVFHKNGIETLVLRPGFSGKVDEFGMLIPFPSPPAIRKLPDNVFQQIAAAIDPPEVVIHVASQGGFSGGFGGAGFGGGGGGGFGGSLGFVPKNQVRVIREEAIGMYEVAVLAAGSAQALKRWMDDHQYAFPSGMDVVCPEYIQQRWCFVAVKTKVKQRAAAQPRPGQREIENDLPAGASFDGHVQAMGFRFRTRQLVVPMRLSVHNSGDLRNVVYLLSDTPSKIRNIPESFVKRQVSGMKLYDQMTEPLPLRIVGGTLDDVSPRRRSGLAAERDPRPHNGIAAELFTSDIVAAKTGRLESRSEVFEKELHKISEALHLRGPDVDQDVKQMLRTERALLVRAALKAVKEMTLTVIDGDFPRDVLARENLTFAAYQMPLEKSDRAHYDANDIFGRSTELPRRFRGNVSQPGGKRPVLAAIPERSTQAPLPPSAFYESRVVGLSCALGLAVAGIVVWRFPHRKAWMMLGGSLCLITASWAAAGSMAAESPTLKVLVRRLGNPLSSEQTVEQIVALGADAVPAMIKQSQSRETLKRGWAIVCLGRIGGPEAISQLKRLRASKTTPPLVKTWSSAAMLKAVLREGSLEELARLLTSQGTLNRSAVLATGPQPLIRVMLQSETPNARRQAAAYVASFPQSPEHAETVAAAVVRDLAFDPSAEATPWDGGPLFLPGLNWQANGQTLVNNLIRWRLWAETHAEHEARRQIDNNLRNAALIQAVGYRAPTDSAGGELLKSWQEIVGTEALRALLAEQHLEEKYAELLIE